MPKINNIALSELLVEDIFGPKSEQLKLVYKKVPEMLGEASHLVGEALKDANFLFIFQFNCRSLFSEMMKTQFQHIL